MVNLQANHQHQQQQWQPMAPQRQRKSVREAVVADDNHWNRQQSSVIVDNDDNNAAAAGANDSTSAIIDDACDRESAIFNERTLSNGASNDLTTDDKDVEIRDSDVVDRVATISESSTRFEEEATSSENCGTVSNVRCGGRCEIGPVDDEELEEEEEEEDYEVEEVDVDTDDDDDCDEETENQAGSSDQWVRKKVLTTRVHRQTNFGGGDGVLTDVQSDVVPHLDETSFGKVCVTNSKHVHVGNTNFYKGPVTIKQFVYTNAYPILDKDDVERNSNERANVVSDNNGVPIVKCDSNGPILNNDRDGAKVTKFLWTWQFAALTCFLALSLVTIVVVIAPLVAKKDEIPSIPDPPDAGSDEDDVPSSSSVRIIDREFWNAQPPASKLDKLSESPVPYVIISHTATEPCTTQSVCVLRVRLIQTLHMDSFHWDDIGYNFLVGGDGLAYRGRGWNLAGAHAFSWNYNSIGISFIGTFNDVKPNKLQLRAARNLIDVGINSSKILPSYKLLGHRQVSKTKSPGDRLYEILQTWEHWSPLPRPISDRAAISTRSISLVFVTLVAIFAHRLFGMLFLSCS